MKKKVTDIIEQKQKTLQELKDKSGEALDIVSATINKLTNVNEQICITVNEILEAKAKLQDTEDELTKTRDHNEKVIEKFRALVEV